MLTNCHLPSDRHRERACHGVSRANFVYERADGRLELIQRIYRILVASVCKGVIGVYGGAAQFRRALACTLGPSKLYIGNGPEEVTGYYLPASTEVGLLPWGDGCPKLRIRDAAGRYAASRWR
jgi:hypothetical protein